MTRHEMRECIFCLMFQNEFYATDQWEEQRDNYLAEKALSEEDRQEILVKCERMIAFLPDIDEIISQYSKGWKIDRIAKAELAILRLAVYEVKYDDDVPVGVAINEAVELAKKYGEDSGASFVNGILGKVADE